jgi:hypothetical protein
LNFCPYRLCPYPSYAYHYIELLKIRILKRADLGAANTSNCLWWPNRPLVESSSTEEYQNSLAINVIKVALLR